MKDPSKSLGDSLQTHKTQSTAEQTMERLIFSLSRVRKFGANTDLRTYEFQSFQQNLSPYHARNPAN